MTVTTYRCGFDGSELELENMLDNFPLDPRPRDDPNDWFYRCRVCGLHIPINCIDAPNIVDALTEQSAVRMEGALIDVKKILEDSPIPVILKNVIRAMNAEEAEARYNVLKDGPLTEERRFLSYIIGSRRFAVFIEDYRSRHPAASV
jgi:hypothetical protein